MKTLIVGGGVAGMTLALQLSSQGHEVTVLEKDAQPGGKVRSQQLGDWRIEDGPAGVLDNAPDTTALVAQLGLADKVVVSDDAARRRFIERAGALREVPDSPPRLVFSPTLTLGEKWRLLREPKAPPPPAGRDETMAEFAERRFGSSLAETFVEPIASGVYAGDYTRLSVRSAFPRIAELEREHGSLLKGLMALEKQRKAEGRPRVPARLTTFQGGMGALSTALHRALGERVKVGADVRAIERLGDGLRVQTSGGPLDAERLVLALPPDDAASLLQPLDAAMAEAYAAIPSSGVASVALGYAKSDIAHPLEGFGFLVPRKEGRQVLGVIWMTSTFPTAGQAPAGHVMLRCMIGGANHPTVTERSDDALIALSAETLRALLGVTAPPRFSHVVRWPHAIPQYTVGHAGRVAAIEERGARLGVYSTGAALRGVGVNDVVREAKALAARLGA